MATENDKVNTGALGTLVVVGVFATLSVALSVTALVRYSVDGVVDQRQSLAQQGYRDLRQEQTAKISANPSWVDKGKGVVSIPIERAKLRVLADLARDPASATPPAPAPTVPAEGTTAPGAAPAPSSTVGSQEGTAAPGAAAPATTTAAVEKPKAPAPATPAPAAAPKPTDG